MDGEVAILERKLARRDQAVRRLKLRLDRQRKKLRAYQKIKQRNADLRLIANHLKKMLHLFCKQ